MRIIAALAIIAAPAYAEEKTLLEQDCMDIVGPVAYGSDDYVKGLYAGITFGYSIAHGYGAADAMKTGEMVGQACRQNPGFTFRDALRVLDQESGPSTTK